jgi:uncharacterized protein YcbX
VSDPGVVAALWRYPVKSMLGEPCEHLDLDARGVVGDRLFAVRDDAGKLGSGKNTRRFRQVDGLLDFAAAGDVPEIVFPDGRRLRGDDPAIHSALGAALGLPVTLAREAEVSHLDAGAVHLLTRASLAWLEGIVPDALADARRFRPNIVAETAAGVGQVEADWVGARLAVGAEVVLRVNDRTQRCRMVNLPQADLPDDPRILRALARDPDVCFGVYAEVVTPGRIRLGDRIVSAPA